ncbi:MAG: hypothetical protein QOI98_1565 [Solirubrobacteraceae bacterium]|jgi:protein SCO1/2|nr:hypothetical protein [Solirubrobacteraceae bacterium]
MKRRRVIVLSLVCGVGIGVGLAVAFRDSGPSPPPLRGPTFPTGLRAPDFSLRDQDGARVALHDYRLDVVLVTFMSTSCPDSCAAVVTQVREAIDQVGHAVTFLAVSDDPAHDTSARARKLLRRLRMTGRMSFLLGSETKLAPVWKSYAFAPPRDALDQPSFVNIVDRVGRLRVGYPAAKLTSDDLAHDVRLLEREHVRVAGRR